MLLGAIADDYTGGSDLAGMLAERGVRTLMHFGVPTAPPLGLYDAAVVCLKSRSIAADGARAMSAAALEWLRSAGARQIQFKYCSTFDSTAAGNIGPVLDELLDNMGVSLVVAVPALPVNGRTQYLGHLFVNGVPLAESAMRHHPLNPMTDSNLVRHLAAQTKSNVGLIPLPVVLEGAGAIGQRAAKLASEGIRMALVDAVTESNLASIAEAIHDAPLISGGSGIAAHLPAYWRLEAPLKAPAPLDNGMPGVLMLAGSCSSATLDQLARYQEVWGPAIRFDAAGGAGDALERTGRALVYSSAPPE
jgi:3-dehydrotetronate 4-kinase